MTSRIIYILILSSLLFSCSEKGVIPEDTLAQIYADIYLADQYIKHDKDLNKQADTLLVYSPIFKKHGYTPEDYDQSIKFYLEQSDKFAEIFEGAQNILKARSNILEKILNQDSKILDLLDTVNIKSSKDILYNDYYRTLNILFFKADTIILENAPIIDSVIIETITNAFFLYDKLPSLDNPFNAIHPIFSDTTKVVKEPKDSLGIKSVTNLKKAPKRIKRRKIISKEILEEHHNI